MTVKELFQSLEFGTIAEVLIEKPYKDYLLSMEEYKEIYDIVCAGELSGSAGTITFKDDGDSDVYMIEGSSLDDIVGMHVILPNNNCATKAEAAADILWSSGPFALWTREDWEALFDYILRPSDDED